MRAVPPGLTTRSSLPSLLKSPVARLGPKLLLERGGGKAALGAALKLPAPSLSRTRPLEAMMSFLPEPRRLAVMRLVREAEGVTVEPGYTGVGAAKDCAELKVPSPLPVKMEIWPLSEEARISSLPSPLMSSTTAEMDAFPGTA